MGKAQISIEYLILIGIALGLLIPGVILFYSYSQSSSGNTINERLNDIGLDAIATAKSTYGLGSGARQTVEFNLPDGVTRVYTTGTELIFVYETPQGQSEAVFFSQVTLNGTNEDGTYNADGNISTHPGLTRYRFISTGSAVTINEVV